MVTDELGAVRHAMTAKELDDLYKSLENFIADCTLKLEYHDEILDHFFNNYRYLGLGGGNIPLPRP